MSNLTGPKYILLDSCVVAAHYVPESARRFNALARRASLLLGEDSADEATGRRLLIPVFCIPEVFSIFAKYRFGKWNNQVKNPIDDLAYWRARLQFRNDIHNGRLLQQVALSRYHILATDLISTIDHYYEFYRSRSRRIRKTPMGAADHLIVAVGIDLVKCRGREDVLIVTADRRLGHILARAKTVRKNSAAKLGLFRIAKDLGLQWGPDVYPEVVNLATASEATLSEAFGSWPPESKAVSASEHARPHKLTETEKKTLVRVYQSVTQGTSESIVYTDEFEVIYEAFLARTGLDVTRTQVWKWLSNIRKASGLPRKRR